jgi:hypothetical protein
MRNIGAKHLYTEFNNTLKRSRSSWFHSRDASMAHHTYINKCYIAQKQNQGQKPHDHLNRFRKAFDKIHHPFMIKDLIKLGEEGIYVNIRKGIYNKHIVNITLNAEN